MTTALAIMRLQPMHNAHRMLIETMLSENDRVVILVGSADKHDDHNPYTAEQRMQMVRVVFPDNKKLIVDKINDLGNPPKWVEYVINQIGFRPDVYYCGGAIDGQLFIDAGIPTKSIGRTDIPISATMVREKIKNNDRTWETLVPQQIIEIIKPKEN